MINLYLELVQVNLYRENKLLKLVVKHLEAIIIPAYVKMIGEARIVKKYWLNFWNKLVIDNVIIKIMW